MKKLVLIDNHDSFTYNLVELIRRLNVEFQVVNIENLNLDQLEDCSHIMISPGPDVPQAYPALFAMLARFHQRKAILGVCLGHQTICEFFGARLFNLPNVRHGKAGYLKLRSKTPLFNDLPEPCHIGLYHSWAVNEDGFPAELQITATDQEGVIMAFQHRKYPIFGVQFHPESYISEQGEQILRQFLQQMPLINE